MGRSAKDKVQVKATGGEVFLKAPRLNAYFRYRRWLIQINPALLFPGLRREHRKIIYVHGKKWGYAEYRGGCVPLQAFNAKAYGLKGFVLNMIRRHWGFCCSQLDRGYYYIHLRTRKYVVTRAVMNDGSIFCRVYFYPEGEPVAAFTIDSDFKKAYPSLGEYNIINTLYVIIAYVADSLLYARFAGALNHTIDII